MEEDIVLDAEEGLGEDGFGLNLQNDTESPENLEFPENWTSSEEVAAPHAPLLLGLTERFPCFELQGESGQAIDLCRSSEASPVQDFGSLAELLESGAPFEKHV